MPRAPSAISPSGADSDAVLTSQVIDGVINSAFLLSQADLAVQGIGADKEGVVVGGDLAQPVGGNGVTLQIGDTSDDFNQMTVSIGDIHTKALGVDGIDISTQGGAQSAVKTIRAAINQVSSIRGPSPA